MKNPNSKNGKVVLFTRQDIRSMEILEEEGRFINKKSYIEDNFGDISNFFLNPYDWFVEEAAKRVAKPKDVDYPTWCAVDWRSALRPAFNSVIYVLVVPEEEIIYFDGLKWDYVLNEHYVPKSAEDLDSYNRELNRLGIETGYEFLRGKYSHMYPLEKKKVLESRENIFIINDWNVFGVQANLWEIKKEWIEKVVHHGEDFTEEDMREILEGL